MNDPVFLLTIDNDDESFFSQECRQWTPIPRGDEMVWVENDADGFHARRVKDVRYDYSGRWPVVRVVLVEAPALWRARERSDDATD